MPRLFVAIGMALILTGCVSAAGFYEPLPKSTLRATPLSFGLHVTTDPDQNPIDPPEEFSGYHVGTDFEVTGAELDADVPIFAICAGPVVYGGFADGYGGLLVQLCTLNGESVTVLYGHLVIEGIPAVDSTLDAGQQISMLAPARSHNSGGNRKHLHLGIHRGVAIDERGYVQTEEEVHEYIDPLSLLPRGFGGMKGTMTPYWAD